MRQTLIINIGGHVPPLTDDQQQRVDALASFTADALKDLTISEMAEVVGRLILEASTWGMLAGERREDILADMLTRSYAYGEAMNLATEQVNASLLARPGAAKALLERQRAKLQQPGATPRSVEQQARKQR